MRLINAYTDAAIDNSWKGAGDPDSIPEIEAYLQATSLRLREYLTLLVANDKK